MKFAEHLAAHITPEWRKQYINYEVLISLKNLNFLMTVPLSNTEFMFLVIKLIYLKYIYFFLEYLSNSYTHI